jgi:hypothetical protein
LLQSRPLSRSEPAPRRPIDIAEQVSGQILLGCGSPAILFRMHIRSVIWKHFDSRDVLPFQQQAFGPAEAIME